MSSLLDTIGKNSTETAPRGQAQSTQVSLSQLITMIKHFSDTRSTSYDDSSDKESLPKQFAIGEGSNAPKREPDINEVFSSDEEMSYTHPRNQEIPSKQFASKVMTFTFDDIPFKKGMIGLTNFMHG
ncbi:unnamed protein product [Thlaspi arvense]|uniref:Uncharacterized protein n=1 Tax=Thlaspi arvense TaxID=13288 RepID=A0AAU9RWM3_THLAR|nr:unnamed protein product [Thlaspi arvense]